MLPQVPLRTVKSSGPICIVGIHFLKVGKCFDGYEYIFITSDHFTRYNQTYATKNKSTRTAVSELHLTWFYDFILRFGSPERIFHDQGLEFENELFHEFGNI